MRPVMLAVVSILVCLGVAEAQGELANARVERHSAAGGLEATVSAVAARERGQERVWVAYTVPSQDLDLHACCSTRGSGDSGVCHLDRVEGGHFTTRPEHGRSRSETLRVFLGLERGRITTMHPFSEACPVDAGGRTVHWLEEVSPEESIALLTGLVAGGGDAADDNGRLGRAAVGVIAHHGDVSADRALRALLQPGHPREIRKIAGFWLGTSRGRSGFEALRDVVEREADTRMRQDLVFPLSQTREPETVPYLVALARDDESPGVRRQALFWLAQKAGRQAEAAITHAVANDPEAAVKRHAVFALSQLPRDQGVPLLIEVARTNPDPAVRRQAFFWLGQSDDERALAFLAEVLR